MSEDEYICSLEKDAEASVLNRLAMLCKQKGVENVFSSFASYDDIERLVSLPVVCFCTSFASLCP
jgi:hypothetical protein